MVIRQIDESSFSDDYQKLLELMKQSSIICVVDYQSIRDVAQTIYSPLELQVVARGIGYIWAQTPEEFVHACKVYNLKFLPPPDRLNPFAV